MLYKYLITQVIIITEYFKYEASTLLIWLFSKRFFSCPYPLYHRPTEFLPVEYVHVRGLEARLYKVQEELTKKTHSEIEEAYVDHYSDLDTAGSVFFPVRVSMCVCCLCVGERVKGRQQLNWCAPCSTHQSEEFFLGGGGGGGSQNQIYACYCTHITHLVGVLRGEIYVHWEEPFTQTCIHYILFVETACNTGMQLWCTCWDYVNYTSYICVDHTS